MRKKLWPVTLLFKYCQYRFLSSQIWYAFILFSRRYPFLCLSLLCSSYISPFPLTFFPFFFVPCGAVVTRAVHGLISIGRISIFHGLAQSSLLKYSIRCRATTHWCLLSKSCPMKKWDVIYIHNSLK